MKFYGIEKLSLVDYDGKIACTVFTGGCNFLCPFCHNATLVLDHNSQKVISEEDIIEYLTKRKGVIDGLAITGGEPTLHSDLPDFIKRIKDLGISVKLDTNGSNPKMLKSLIDASLIDYVAMDIKNSFAMYPITVGIVDYDTKKIEQSAEFLLQGKVDYEFRTTLVKGLHTKEDFIYICDKLKGAKRYFLQKFTDKGNCIDSGFSEIDKEQAEEFKSILKKNISKVELRGYD